MITLIGSPKPDFFKAEQGTATERADESFKFICKNILEYGSFDEKPRPKYSDGTPAHTFSVNHVIQTFDLQNGDFPLLSLRNIAVKSAIGEILWIYKDQSNSLDKFAEYGVTWWDKWDIGDRTIGQCYGQTVKKHKIIDNLIHNLKNDHDSRRHIIDLYQYEDFNQEHGLKPCALFSEYNVRHSKDGDYLDGFLLLRSSDFVMAGAINEVQYIALLKMLAQICGFKVGNFTCAFVNCQIYDRHVDPVKEMLTRESIPANPYLEVNPDVKELCSFKLSDFSIKDYPRDTINEKNPQLNLDIGI
jgi:thymidylate synthase